MGGFAQEVLRRRFYGEIRLLAVRRRRFYGGGGFTEEVNTLRRRFFGQEVNNTEDGREFRKILLGGGSLARSPGGPGGTGSPNIEQVFFGQPVEAFFRRIYPAVVNIVEAFFRRVSIFVLSAAFLYEKELLFCVQREGCVVTQGADDT